jgi:hypothetical protein
MKTKTRKSRGLLFFIILGILSVVWFLIRVIPKPSRITYPCQRMAATNAAGFITWLFGTMVTFALFKNAREKLKESRRAMGIAMILLAVFAAGIAFMLPSYQTISARILNPTIDYDPTDLNMPLGTARGIFPGRVAWAYNPEAVQYNPAAANGFWWEDQNTIPEKVDEMFTRSLDAITGATTSYAGWDSLFKASNEILGKGDVGYAPGEKIAIKANLLVGLGGGSEQWMRPMPAPQLLFSMVEDLIVVMGIPGEYITVYDVSARIPDPIMDPFKNHENSEFQQVRFVGNPGYITDDRYIAAREDTSYRIHFADTSVTSVYLVKSITESDYLINLTNFKAHNMAGVTLCAKNLYGSVYIPTATDLYTNGFGPNNKDGHSGLHRCATVHDFEDGNVGFFPAREMGTFNYLVDIMGHPEIYNKTMLYIVDGLYGCSIQNKIDKFISFGRKYSASLFMSQDPVALESVSVDFLRNEPVCATYVQGYVDNWLHESSQANDPASGMVYDPAGKGIPLESLGVHEHWNNAEDKQYTRNLGTGEGIELYRVGLATGIDPGASTISAVASLQPNYPNPFLTGTTIPFELSRNTRLSIDVYDQAGRLIENLAAGEYPAGSFRVYWEPAGSPAGVYFCRLTTSHGTEETIKLQKLQ